MSKIHAGGVVMGGLLAGLVMNVIDFVVNVPILGAQWNDATRVLGVDPQKLGGQSAVGWIVTDFVLGVLLVWSYAGIRPRFGPGPRTALIASLAAWLISHIGFSSYAFTGLYPPGLILASVMGALVACLAGGQAGCWLYKEI